MSDKPKRFDEVRQDIRRDKRTLSFFLVGLAGVMLGFLIGATLGAVFLLL